MGIGGSGMSSIAKYLKQKGHDVEGYDQRISYITNLLESDGVKTCQNIDNFRYQEDVLYVISSAINLEDTFLASYSKNENVISRPKFLELLSEEVEILGITGTHGKTSTTALVSHIFHFNNKDASFIYGGVSGFGNLGGHFGEKTQPLILETDEAFNTFKNINIKDLIVTNIDNDHLDFYDNKPHKLEKTFFNFMEKLPFFGTAIICVDCKKSDRVFKKLSRELRKYQTIYLKVKILIKLENDLKVS